MEWKYVTTGIMVSITALMISSCNLPGSAYVGMWQSTRVSPPDAAYIEISRVGVTRFEVYSWITSPLPAHCDDYYNLCGDDLCVEDNLTVRTNRIRFLAKDNPNILLNGEIGNENPNFWQRLARQDTYKRVK